MPTSTLTAKARSTPVAPELRDVERSDPRETIRRAAGLMSARVGIVRHLGHGRYHAQDPCSYAMGIVASDLSRFTDIVNSSKGGGGGDVLAGAIAATLGEAAERYSMFFYDRDAMVLAPWREVAADALEPDRARLYSREQLEGLGSAARVTYFDENAVIRWVWGWSLTEQRPRLVPASLVYMNYQPGDDEQVIGRNASGGLAAGLTLEEALLTGLYEVVERDAFTTCWLCRRPGRRVEIDDGEMLDWLRRRFHHDHPAVDLRVYDASLDVPITACFVVMRRPAEFGPAICVGSAARLEPKAAVHKCLLEAGQGIPYFRFLLGQLGDWEPAEDYSDLTSFDHHCVFYLRRPNLVPEAFAFLDEPDGEVALSGLPDRSTGRVLGDLQRCLELVREAGLEVVMVEITTPDVAQLGLRVVRVLIPGMVPLHGVYKYPFLGARRLAEFPPTFGAWPEGGRRRENFNPFPHPFP